MDTAGVSYSINPRRSGDYIGFVFDSDEQFHSAIVPFVKEGVEAMERVVCILGKRLPDEIASRLRDAGVEVDRLVSCGQLALFPVNDFFKRCVIANADGVTELLHEELAISFANRFRSMRLAVEVTDCSADEDHWGNVMKSGRFLNEFARKNHVSVFCLYDRTRLHPEVIINSLLIHTKIALNGGIMNNYFYTSPDETVSADLLPMRLELALSNLWRIYDLEKQVKALREEKDVALKEIHHRVKNNLQVISSLLSLQCRSMPEGVGRAMMRDAQSRIKSMALVHEKLYGSDNLAQLNLREYIESFSHHLHCFHRHAGSNIELVVDCEDVLLGVDQAVPSGLILNELLSNCYKHAFDPGKDGKVSICLRRRVGQAICLTVRDNGKGLPAGIDVKSVDSMGLMLVSMLAAQLSATLEFTVEQGTEVRLVIPVPTRPDVPGEPPS